MYILEIIMWIALFPTFFGLGMIAIGIFSFLIFITWKIFFEFCKAVIVDVEYYFNKLIHSSKNKKILKEKLYK